MTDKKHAYTQLSLIGKRLQLLPLLQPCGWNKIYLDLKKGGCNCLLARTKWEKLKLAKTTEHISKCSRSVKSQKKKPQKTQTLKGE